MDDGYVAVKEGDFGITILSFFHPKHNALTKDLLEKLTAELEKAGKVAGTKVIVLKSDGGGTFCAGASFDELLRVQNEVEGAHFFSGFAELLNACRRCPKIILGRVQGKAIGGGVGLAAATDYCFATDEALVRLSEVVMGIGAFVIEPAIVRKAGVGAFTELTFNPSEYRNAAWAKEKGLFAEVFRSVNEMDVKIFEFARQFDAYNPLSLSALKAALWRGTENWGTLLAERAAISGRLVCTDLAQKALSKFKKR